MSSWVDRRARSRLTALSIGAGLGLVVLVASLALRKGGGKVVDFKRTTGSATALMEARAKALAAVKDGGQLQQSGRLPRFPIDAKIASQIFPLDSETQQYDPETYFRHPANMNFKMAWEEHPNGWWLMHTNSLGIREDGEPLALKPNLRILVTGDSHTEGVCNNFESLAHVLGRALTAAHPGKTIESINAAKGAYTFYNYLGTLEKFLYLKPDVFIVVVYGPNDFEEVLTPWHFFSGTVRAPGSSMYWPQVEKALKVCPTWLAQDGNSLKYFQEQPSEIKQALLAAKAATIDINDICKSRGIALIYAYLPGRFDSQEPLPEKDAALAAKLYQALEVRPKSTRLHENMGNALLAFLAEQGIPTLDLRKVFRANKGPFYWESDQHINVAAHKLIGESLVPFVEKAVPGLLR